MTTAKALPGLPDPEIAPEFYADVSTKRFLAWIADVVLICLITAIIIPFTAFTALFFLPMLFLVVSFCYRALSLVRRSATPGMRLMAIQFRRHDGQVLDPGTAFIHTLLYAISISMVLPQVISIFLMLTTARGQGLTDHFLGTAAINRASDAR